MVVEVEAKFKVADLDELEYLLVEQGASLVEIVNQRDIYLSSPITDFSKTDEVLRIRQEADDIYLTYKGPKFDKKSKTRIEVSAKVESLADISNVLEQLGFCSEYVVSKERKVYSFKGFLFCLDQVDNLGSYLEIEQEIESMLNYESIQEELFELAQSLGLKAENTIRDSYLQLLYENTK